MTNPSALSTYFNYTTDPQSLVTIPRLAMSLDGLDKRGKSHYAIMTTPQPVLVASCDTGTEVIVNKARAAGRKVGLMQIQFNDPAAGVRKAGAVNQNEHAQWKAEWAKFKSACDALIAEPEGPNRTRTFVWDTGTDIKNLLELSWFGKLTGNARQDLRTDMNADFHQVFWSLYKGRPDLNILIIHKHKKVYVKDAKGQAIWTGDYERSGHSNIGYFVDLTLTFDWEPLYQDFYTTIKAEHPFRYHDPSRPLMGQKWYATKMPADPSTFWNLGMKIFPQTINNPEVWF